jgi:hypothetical protein
MDWLRDISTPDVAKWAVNTVPTVIKGFFDGIVESRPDFGPLLKHRWLSVYSAVP